MKRIAIVVFLVSKLLFANAQTFQVDYPHSNSYPQWIVENKQGFFLMTNFEENQGSYDLKFSLLDKNGKMIRTKFIKGSDSVSYTISKIFVTDSNYICFGTKNRLLHSASKAKYEIWVAQLSFDLNIISEFFSPLTNQYEYNPIAQSITQHKGLYYIGGTLVHEKELLLKAYIAKIDIKNKKITQKNNYKFNSIISSILSIKNSLLIYGNNLREISDDSLGIIKENFENLGVNVQGNLKKLSDSTYALHSSYDIDGTLGLSQLKILLLKLPFIKSSNTFTMGKKDTMNSPPFLQSIDIYNQNNIYVGGTSNYNIWESNFNSKQPSWFLLANLNDKLKPNWHQYYGGDAYYEMMGLLATTDGGCLMYGTKYKYNSTEESSIYLLKVNSLGQLLAADGTPLPEENIKVFPNPATTMLNISASDSQEKLTIQCIDIQGRNVYQCNFQGFTQINTSDWQRGIYVYIIRNEKGVIVKTEKVIIINY